jgi:hypothetical protein
MSIIIISSDAVESEKDIAEKVAAATEYQLLDRSILPSVAKRYEVDADRLKEALDNRPSWLQKMPSKLWRFLLAAIEAEVCDRLLEDRMVCRGLGAHLYVRDVSHVLKVRILSPKENSNERYSEHRKKWSQEAYGFDETNPSYFDLVINLDKISTEEAVQTITGAVAYRKFLPMTYSIKCLSDQVLAAKVSLVLLKSMSNINVRAQDGAVIVTTRASTRDKRKKIAAIKELACNINGVNYVEVHVKKNISQE